MTGASNWQALTPEMVLAGGALILLLLDAARPHARSSLPAVLTLVVIAGAGYFAALQWIQEPAGAYANMIVRDHFGTAARWVVLFAAAIATLASPSWLRPRGLEKGEYYALLLLVTSGMTMLVVAADLIMVFLAIELLSLGLYVMAGFERSNPASQEASMKYFLLGAFASAFLLYGIAFVYGASGTTNLLALREIVAGAAIEDFRLLAFAVALLAVGLGFKAAMVPFHMWTPDVYQGAPTPVTAFMAGGTKAASFAAMVRVFVWAMPELRWDWRPPVAVLAVLTLAVGSVLAVSQTDVKRMLAYSSVAHAGYLGIAVVASSRTGVGAVLLYLFVYTAMTMGAFGCVMLLRQGDGERTQLSSYAGLGVRHPGVAALLALFLFSLAGIPPTGGFFAKLAVFTAAAKAGYTWLAVVAVVASMVSAFFYIRVAVVMFMQEPAADDDMPLWSGAGLRASLAVCALTVALTGLLPGLVLGLAEKAARFG